jgi:hypothetical protein
MYKRHSIWDEDKLDIHSSGYAGSSSGSSGRGYAGDSSGSKEEYHKNEMYGSNKETDFKPTDDYRSRDEKEDARKKENEEKEKTIVDAVEQEEKYQKRDEQEEGFHAVARDLQQSDIGRENTINKNNNKEIKKRNNKNIEEAVNEAIKEEKEIVHVD